MTISVFDLFKVGIGPSSSHTVGPMKAAYLFVDGLRADGLLDGVARVHVELFGSLGATGHGHGSVKAVVLGLSGEQPHLVDPVAADPAVQEVRDTRRLRLAGTHGIDFVPDDDIVMHRRKRLDFHSNGMTFQAFDADRHRAAPAGVLLRRRRVRPRRGRPRQPGRRARRDTRALPVLYRRRAAGHRAARRGCGSATWCSPTSWSAAPRTRCERAAGDLGGDARVHRPRERTPGVLPGGLKVRRRAAELKAKLDVEWASGVADPLDGDGVGDALRAGGQRGERRRRSGRDRTDQRRRRHHPRGAALLPPLRARAPTTTASSASC